MAAYERTLMPTPARFDHYVAGILGQSEGLTETLTEEELAGLDLFINKGQCIDCHNSPLFTNHEFHNTGVAAFPDPARLEGAQLVQNDPFNCLGAYSDAAPDACTELRFIKLHYKALKGKRSHEHSIRLNKQWRLVVERAKDETGRYLWIINIEDYH